MSILACIWPILNNFLFQPQVAGTKFRRIRRPQLTGLRMAGTSSLNEYAAFRWREPIESRVWWIGVSDWFRNVL